MKKIENEEELLAQLKQDVATSNKDKIVLQSGHFPLFYLEQNQTAIEAINYWGEFSTYTLELACKIADYAKKSGKEVEFAFFADDHSYGDMSGLHRDKRSKRRSRLYKERSGLKATLPEIYKSIMQQYGFDESFVHRHNHGRLGREDCLYFSELILRSTQREVDNACAREYTEFIESKVHFDKEESHLISFVPRRCTKHICDIALEEEIIGISASHVFMETMLLGITRVQLFSTGSGIIYRKD